MAFAGYTTLELRVIALRTNGIKGSEIATMLGVRRQIVYDALWSACKKAGIENDVALLTRWAMKWGFDEPLGPETSAERPYPGKPKQGPYRRTRWPLRDARKSV